MYSKIQEVKSGKTFLRNHFGDKELNLPISFHQYTWFNQEIPSFKTSELLDVVNDLDILQMCLTYLFNL